jgi:hypothetical protein
MYFCSKSTNKFHIGELTIGAIGLEGRGGSSFGLRRSTVAAWKRVGDGTDNGLWWFEGSSQGIYTIGAT